MEEIKPLLMIAQNTMDWLRVMAEYEDILEKESSYPEEILEKFRKTEGDNGT